MYSDWRTGLGPSQTTGSNVKCSGKSGMQRETQKLSEPSGRVLTSTEEARHGCIARGL